MSVFDEFGKVWMASSPLTDNFRTIKKAIDAGADTIVLKSVTSLAKDTKPTGRRIIKLHKLVDEINHYELPFPNTLSTTSTNLDCEMITVKKSNELYHEVKKYSPKTKVIPSLAPVTVDDFALANQLEGDAIEINHRWYDLGIKRPYYLLLNPYAEVEQYGNIKDKKSLLMSKENATKNAKVEMFDIKNGNSFFIGQDATIEKFIELVIQESNNYWSTLEQKEEAFKQGVQSIYGQRPLLIKLARQGMEINVGDYERMTCDGITFSDSMKGGTLTALAGMKLHIFGKGSICGSFLTEETLDKIHFYYHKHHPDKYVSASGGIMNADIAQQAIAYGAGSVQLCSAVYFHGFKVIEEVAKKLH